MNHNLTYIALSYQQKCLFGEATEYKVLKLVRSPLWFNERYVNEVTLKEQNLSLKCNQSLEVLICIYREGV